MEFKTGITGVAEEFYSRLITHIREMYKICGDKLGKTLDEVLFDADEYTQVCLVLIAVSDKEICEEEVEFLQNVVKSKPLYQKFKLYAESQKSLTNEQKEKLIEYSYERVYKVPYYMELAVLCDKYNDENFIKKHPTNCQIVYDSLNRLTNYVKFVDDKVLKIEDKMNKEIILPIRAYFKSKYVKFAREREGE